jgi:hypothetical protein
VPDYDWRAMNGPDHHREAERFLEEVESCEEPGSRVMWCLELAKLHTALAQVAATASNSDSTESIVVLAVDSAAKVPRRTGNTELTALLRKLDHPAGDASSAGHDTSRRLVRVCSTEGVSMS